MKFRRVITKTTTRNRYCRAADEIGVAWNGLENSLNYTAGTHVIIWYFV